MMIALQLGPAWIKMAVKLALRLVANCYDNLLSPTSARMAVRMVWILHRPVLDDEILPVPCLAVHEETSP